MSLAMPVVAQTLPVRDQIRDARESIKVEVQQKRVEVREEVRETKDEVRSQVREKQAEVKAQLEQKRAEVKAQVEASSFENITPAMRIELAVAMVKDAVDAGKMVPEKAKGFCPKPTRSLCCTSNDWNFRNKSIFHRCYC